MATLDGIGWAEGRTMGAGDHALTGRAERFTDPTHDLIGRRRECAHLAELVSVARDGHSQALVLEGDPGIGKTALLDFLKVAAAGCLVIDVAGVESEMELAYAGLHQICIPLLDGLDRVPAPQRDALRTTSPPSWGARGWRTRPTAWTWPGWYGPSTHPAGHTTK